MTYSVKDLERMLAARSRDVEIEDLKVSVAQKRLQTALKDLEICIMGREATLSLYYMTLSFLEERKATKANKLLQLEK